METPLPGPFDPIPTWTGQGGQAGQAHASLLRGSSLPAAMPGMAHRLTCLGQAPQAPARARAQAWPAPSSLTCKPWFSGASEILLLAMQSVWLK